MKAEKTPCPGISVLYMTGVILAWGLLLGAITGCMQNETPVPTDNRPDFLKGLAFGEKDVSESLSKAKSIEIYLGVEKRRHGLYYFPYTGARFTAAFEKFFDAHPELEAFSIAGDSDATYDAYNGRGNLGKLSEGAIPRYNNTVSTHAGYFVLTRTKSAESR